MLQSKQFDRLAVALSAICIVHCLAIPLAAMLLPVAAVAAGSSNHFHQLMLWLVVPISIVGIGLGVRIHRKLGIVVLGLVGLLILAFASLRGHGAWPEALEVSVSVGASALLGVAHWLNFKEVRRLHQHG
jgi:hypothetical protein